MPRPTMRNCGRPAGCGLRSDVMALPQGLDTMLGEGGLGLSGGQSRRLALARLLLSPGRAGCSTR
jgi:ABC-type bacteriocin/lantibiotic exporter with double-glycine peptidase domain